MIDYLIHRPDGSIAQRGSCHSEDDVPVIPGFKSELIQPNDERLPTVVVPATYKEFRQMDYPPIGEQLDILWKIFDRLAATKGDPESQAMLDRVKAVKTRYPKPLP